MSAAFSFLFFFSANAGNYNAYAAWDMCIAGFEVVDVLSASFPKRCDSSYDLYDSVHFLYRQCF